MELKTTIIKNHVEDMAKGIDSDLEARVTNKLKALTKKELTVLLTNNEIYFAKKDNKEELIERFVSCARTSLGMMILRMNDVIGETIQEYYSRMYNEFYN